MHGEENHNLFKSFGYMIDFLSAVELVKSEIERRQTTRLASIFPNLQN